MKQAKLTYSTLRIAFEKQIKTIGYKEKQIKALKVLKPVEH